MAKATFILLTERDRGFAVAAVMRAPIGKQVRISKPDRTRDQNAALHAALSDIAAQLPWPKDTGELHGIVWWKRRLTLLWMKETKQEVEVVEDLEGEEFGLLLPHTSDLPVDQHASLREFVISFGALRGVIYKEKKNDAPDGEDDGYEAYR